jgi:hypothetical protein
MISKIIEFFSDSGKLIISPEELFYLRGQKKGYYGILSVVFYLAFLSLMIGILLQDLTFGLIAAVGSIVFTLVFKFIHAVTIHIFAKVLFGGEGNLFACYNLICYPSCLYIFLIVGLALTVLNKMFLFPVILLVILWQFVIVITAVDTEYGMDFGKAFLSTYGLWLIILAILMGIV